MVPFLAALMNVLVPTIKGTGVFDTLILWCIETACSGVSNLWDGFKLLDWNISFQVFQSMSGLYLSSQERPNMTELEGDLITLNTMLLWWFPNEVDKGLVSWTTSPDIRGLPSITSIGTRIFLVTKGNLCSAKSLSIKQAEALKSNKALTVILRDSNYILRDIVKQGEASEKKIGLVDCALFASCTVPTVARHRRFLSLQLPSMALNLLWCIETCVALRSKLSFSNFWFDGQVRHNTCTNLFFCIDPSLLE